MKRKKHLNCWLVFIIVLAILMPFVRAEVMYVDGTNGNDANRGTEDKPLRTIARAAVLVNNSKEPGPTTIKIKPGIYVINKTVTFKNQHAYTRDTRLTIEATILPDDPGWKPVHMPVVLSTEIPEKWEKSNAPIETSGLKVEVSHVTIRGIKFLGNPVSHIWYYPVFREGKNLEDLLVTQCLFVMDNYAMSSNVAIIANGHGLVVDHFIFYKCRNPVVFWNTEGGVSRKNAMRYCIVDGATTSGVWVCQTAEDFDFHHHIITRSACAWMRNSSNRRTYHIHDCIITDNKCYSMQCGPDWNLSPTGPEIVYKEKEVVAKEKVVLKMGNGIDVAVPRNFLHPVPGTPGSDLGAGLFK